MHVLCRVQHNVVCVCMYMLFDCRLSHCPSAMLLFGSKQFFFRTLSSGIAKMLEPGLQPPNPDAGHPYDQNAEAGIPYDQTDVATQNKTRWKWQATAKGRKKAARAMAHQKQEGFAWLHELKRSPMSNDSIRDSRKDSPLYWVYEAGRPMWQKTRVLAFLFQVALALIVNFRRTPQQHGVYKKYDQHSCSLTALFCLQVLECSPEWGNKAFGKMRFWSRAHSEMSANTADDDEVKARKDEANLSA